jgi:sugar lactone lactonase YvrE
VECISLGAKEPVLIVADGGAPIAGHKDGHLYYGLDTSGRQVAVGMTRISSNGKRTAFAENLATKIEKLGITGLSNGPDGALYAACLTSIFKIQTNGMFSRIADASTLKGCDSDAETSFLRGLAVDKDGSIYAAATGCRQVIRVSPKGEIDVILKAESPWSPTGVAVHGGNVYVLEYTWANGAATQGWLPRVRKIASNGQVSVLATISKEQQEARPNGMKF